MLTPKEKQVLEGFAIGKPHTAIANQLGCSVREVCQIAAKALMKAERNAEFFDRHKDCSQIIGKGGSEQ